MTTTQHEYFIVANSFAAPFFSDESTHYVQADTPESALNTLSKTYSHSCGLYAANCYASADAYHKRQPKLARWLSNHAAAIEDAGPTLLRSDGPGLLYMDGKNVVVENPKQGSVRQ